MTTPRTPIRQATFGAGELSDRVIGRTDIPQYAQGVLSSENWMVQPQGSITRRPGLKYIGTKKTVTFPQTTERSSATGAIDLNAVCFAAELGLNGRWVAVGDDAGTDSMIVTCDADANGAPSTWTAVAGGSIPDDEQLNAICWSGALFVAVGNNDGTAGTIYTSPDGLVWTKRTSNAGANNLNAVCWTGTSFVAVGATGANVSSGDGVTWAAGTGLLSTNDYFGVASAGNVLVAVGADNTNPLLNGAVYYSTNGGATWALGQNKNGNVLRAVLYTNGYWYIAGWGNAGGAQKSGVVYRTTDPTVAVGSALVTDNAGHGGAAVGYNAICVVGAYLFTVGVLGTTAYSLASDGTLWTKSTIETVTFNGIAVSPKYATVVGDDDATDAQLFTLPLDTSRARLIRFTGSTGDPYMMEVGQQYIRFYRNEVRIDSSPGTAYEVTSPWDANDLPDLKFCQANDVMYFAHPNYPPRKLVRTGEAAFTMYNLMDTSSITTNIFTSTYKLWDGPYFDENSSLHTMTLSATGTGAKTVTLSNIAAINNGQGFLSTDIGRVVRIFSAVDGSKLWGWGIITARGSSTSATINMIEDPSTTSAETRWAMGAWSDTSGYPSTVTFYQQRLVWGGTRSQPMSTWESLTASFEENDPTQTDDTIVDDNAVYLTIAAQRMSAIQWLISGFSLAIGTLGGVYFLDGGGGQNAITPGQSRTRLGSEFDAADVQPAAVGDLIVYVQAGTRKIRGLAPGSTADVYSQPDLTLLAEHITRTGVEEMVFASTPFSAVWMRRTDGVLIALTLEPGTQTIAWSEHPIAGTLAGADFPAVLSIEVLPTSSHDQLWAIVRRTINGSQVEYIEAMQLPLDSLTDDPDEGCYLDGAVRYDGVSATAMSGLSHLEGESVYAFTKTDTSAGVMQGPYTVASGAITLGTAATKAWIGLSYAAQSDLETMPVSDPRLPGQTIRVITTMVEMLDTLGFKIGATFTTQETYAPTTLTTTARKFDIGDDGELRTTICISPITGLPCTITGLTHFIEYAAVES